MSNVLSIQATPEEWRSFVDGRAEYIRGLIRDRKLFGKEFRTTDINALLVAAYLEGVHQGTVNSLAVKAEFDKQKGK